MKFVDSYIVISVRSYDSIYNNGKVCYNYDNKKEKKRLKLRFIDD